MHNEGITPTWSLYEQCKFLNPFINTKHERKSECDNDDHLLPSQLPLLKGPFDEKLLIKHVKERPQIYDKQHEDFRSPIARRNAFEDISSVTGWDVKILQRRWRVMRDRFVRELRRTKNIDTDAHLDCSVFFRDMLFLARHVRSKSYEVEADIHSDASLENWEVQENADDSGKSMETARTEIKIKLEDEKTDAKQNDAAAIENFDHVEDYATDDAPEYLECFDTEESLLEDNVEVVYEEESVENVEGATYFQDNEESIAEMNPNEQKYYDNVDDVVAVQEILEDQWIKNEPSSFQGFKVVQKRQATEDLAAEMSPKRLKEHQASVSQEPTQSVVETKTIDEDVAFGQTIGLMLKKIPNNLKTPVKVLLLQCLSEFELNHNLH